MRPGKACMRCSRLSKKIDSLVEEVGRLTTALNDYQAVVVEYGGMDQGVEVNGPDYLRLCISNSAYGRLVDAARLVLEDATEWNSVHDSHFQTTVEGIETLQEALESIEEGFK